MRDKDIRFILFIICAAGQVNITLILLLYCHVSLISFHLLVISHYKSACVGLCLLQFLVVLWHPFLSGTNVSSSSLTVTYMSQYLRDFDYWWDHLSHSIFWIILCSWLSVVDSGLYQYFIIYHHSMQCTLIPGTS